MSYIPRDPFSKLKRYKFGLVKNPTKCLIPEVPIFIIVFESFYATFHTLKAPTFFELVMKSPLLLFIQPIEFIP